MRERRYEENKRKEKTAAFGRATLAFLGQAPRPSGKPRELFERLLFIASRTEGSVLLSGPCSAFTQSPSLRCAPSLFFHRRQYRRFFFFLSLSLFEKKKNLTSKDRKTSRHALFPSATLA